MKILQPWKKVFLDGVVDDGAEGVDGIGGLGGVLEGLSLNILNLSLIHI